MKEDLLAAILEERNPWWKDPRIRPAREKNWIFHRSIYSELLEHMLSEEKRALVLRGPRQVGKTVLLLQVVDDLLEKVGIPPRNLVFFDFSDDRLYSEISPRDVVDACSRSGHRDFPFFFFLDEITKAEKWSEWLKQAVDWTRHRFLVTDSSASLLREGKGESGPGRWDTKILEPLNFREFLGLVSGRKGRWEDLLMEDPALPELYLLLGGFPEHARRDVDEVKAIERIREDLASRVVARDLARSVGEPEELVRLFSLLVQESGAILNVDGLRSVIGGSPNTIKKWLALLEDSLLLHRLQAWSLKAGNRVRKQPRLYAADPGIISAFHAGEKQERRGKAFEAALFRHLREAKGRLGEEFGLAGLELFFFRTKNQEREVDFVLHGEDGLLALEVTSSTPDGEKRSRLLKGVEALKENSGARNVRALLVHGGELERADETGRALPLWKFLLRPEEVLLEEWKELKGGKG